jgi:hypothetical protein
MAGFVWRENFCSVRMAMGHPAQIKVGHGKFSIHPKGLLVQRLLA